MYGTIKPTFHKKEATPVQESTSETTPRKRTLAYRTIRKCKGFRSEAERRAWPDTRPKVAKLKKKST